MNLRRCSIERTLGRSKLNFNLRQDEFVADNKQSPLGSFDINQKILSVLPYLAPNALCYAVQMGNGGSRFDFMAT